MVRYIDIHGVEQAKIRPRRPMQVAACGNGARSSVAATEAEADAKSCVNEFVAKIVANAFYTVSKSEQAAC